MDKPLHDLRSLCQQLGLPSEPAALQAFIEQHGPLDGHLALADAPFWSAAQAAFLREQLEQDGDWAGVIDHLAVLLHRHP